MSAPRPHGTAGAAPAAGVPNAPNAPNAPAAAGRELDLDRAHLALALEAGRMGTWEWDIAAGRVSWSAQEERLYGMEPGSFDGSVESYVARIHPDDRAAAWRTLEEAVARRAETHHVVHRVVRPDGAVRWLDSHGRFLFDDAGVPVRLVGVSTDVTERRAMEEALRYENYIRDTITNNATAGLFMMDEDGRCTFMNPAAEAMTGFRQQEIGAVPLHYAVHHHRPDGSLYPMADCPIDRALPENFDVRAHEDVFIRKDGTYFPVLCAASPIFEDGRPVGTVVEVRDVTEDRRRERALRASEERYAYASRATSNAIWDWDFASGHVGWNPGVRTVFGYGEGEVEETAAWWYDHIHPDDRERVVTGIHAVIDLAGGPTAWQDEYRFRRGDGTHAWIVDRGYVARDEAGVATRMIGAMEDVTLPREAEARLRRSEERFRSLARAIGLTWVTNLAGEVEEDMPEWRAYTGQREGGVQGFGWVEALHPDDRERSAAAWRAAVEGTADYDVDYRLRGADGVYRWFNARGAPVRNPDGTIREWVGVTIDVDARYRAEAERDRALAEARAERGRLHEVFTLAPSAIAMTEGREHRVVLANDSYDEIAGRRALVGRTIREAFPELEGQGFFELLDRAFESGEPFVGNEVAARLDRDGDGAPGEYYFNFTYQPLRDIAGAVSGILVHAVEVTDQVRSRREVERRADELARVTDALERSNRELDQFAYVASHDLKAPLRGIANLTQWIEEDLGDSVTADSAEHMRLLQGRVHRMEALIDGILAYSRAGRVREQPERVDTGALVADVVELLAPGPGVVVEVQPGLPVVEAERVPLQQVFMNLVANAVKYAGAVRPDVVVRVGALKTPEGVEFTVADNGAGIPGEYHERIWGIFQTLHARDKVEGTGIGLSVVKKIVESRGGRAWVESPPGEGATFHFTWPRAARPDTRSVVP